MYSVYVIMRVVVLRVEMNGGACVVVSVCGCAYTEGAIII